MKKPSAALVGAFVVGAFILLAAGIAALGAGRFLARHPTYVMFFEGSVKGLSGGAPVMFKGVSVGKVEKIGLQYDPEAKKVRIAVISAIDLKSITWPDGEAVSEAFFQGFVRQGLKAQLQFQNYVTGQLLVDLDFFPGRPARFVRAPLPYPEIPTTPSSLEQISKGVENVPLDQVVARLAAAVDNLSALASSPELRAVLQDLRLVSRTLGRDVGPLMAEAGSALRVAKAVLQRIDGRSAQLGASAEETLEDARAALERTEKVLAQVDHAGAGGQNIADRLVRSLEKTSDAADSLKALADYLNRHPEALITGKRD